MYTANEIMFPVYVIPELRSSRGPDWQKLIERISQLPESHEEVLAFVLLMVRLNGCLECENDSYRAMKGCSACAVQTLRRYKASDSELLAEYTTALEDVRLFMQRRVHLEVV